MNTEVAKLSEERISDTYRLIPNFQALDPDTVYKVYRELIPRRNVVEFTILYDEPDKETMRVDAEISEETFHTVPWAEVGPEHVRITEWRTAKREG